MQLRNIAAAVSLVILAATPLRAAELPTCADLAIVPDLPFDAALANQAGFNCFAWRQFIALNWVADSAQRGQPDPKQTAADFGVFTPGEWTVAETYRNPNDVFRPGAGVPPNWAEPTARPPVCGSLKAVKSAHDSGALSFQMTTKMFEPHRLDDGIIEAGQGENAWLIGQNGKLTYFDVRVNQDLYEYVQTYQFYDPAAQYAAVLPGGDGIKLPAGDPATGVTGAMELKSSWLEIADPADWPTHRTIKGIVATGKAEPACRVAHFAMMGMHIAHKTETATQWAWATFEHVDNAPNQEEMKSGQLKAAYTYNDPDCPEADCAWNAKRASAAGNPVQVVRMTPIADVPGAGNNVATLNAQAQALIAKAAPDSVWQHYELVNVLWPESPVPVDKKPEGHGPNVPLPYGGATPEVMANATLETYAQHDNCLDCHRQATIAADATPNGETTYASDFSFMFSRACSVKKGADNPKNCYQAD
jgi:hypothetical protein